MTGARLRAACRGRVEIVEVSGTQWRVGAGGDVDVRLGHASVAEHHADLLERRGRYVVRPAPRARVVVDGEIAGAPFVLDPTRGCQLGEVTLDVAPPAPETEAIRAHLRGEARELAPGRAGRRFRDEAGEVCWMPAADPAWSARFARALDGAPGLAEADGPWATAGGWTWRERLPEGVRLAALWSRLEAGALRLPPEAAVALIGQLGDALDALHTRFGPHGGLSPEAVHLGARGEVRLVRPGPGAALVSGWTAPERRTGGPASAADDAFALASLAVTLLSRCGASTEAWAPFTACLQSDPERRALDARAAAEACRARAEAQGLDPTSVHLGRAVRLLVAERRNPLILDPLRMRPPPAAV